MNTNMLKKGLSEINENEKHIIDETSTANRFKKVMRSD